MGQLGTPDHVAWYQPLPGWRESARCKGEPSEAFFPTLTRGPKVGDDAKIFCDDCAVRRDCLADALAQPQRFDEYGWRGGVSATRRRQIRKQAARTAQPPPPLPPPPPPLEELAEPTQLELELIELEEEGQAA